MPIIELTTLVNASIERVFNLSRSIDLHSISTHKTNEKAIAGVTSGLINKGETVTWEAIHFGIKQQLTSKITALEFPNYFRDEMQKGAFKSIYHEHIFQAQGSQTIMVDKFNYEAPWGIIGKFFNKIILNQYMNRFLVDRNQIIKQYAESDLWKTVLQNEY